MYIERDIFPPVVLVQQCIFYISTEIKPWGPGFVVGEYQLIKTARNAPSKFKISMITTSTGFLRRRDGDYSDGLRLVKRKRCHRLLARLRQSQQ
jgi:hypothetical protein